MPEPRGVDGLVMLAGLALAWSCDHPLVLQSPSCNHPLCMLHNFSRLYQEEFLGIERGGDSRVERIHTKGLRLVQNVATDREARLGAGKAPF